MVISGKRQVIFFVGAEWGDGAARVVMAFGKRENACEQPGETRTFVDCELTTKCFETAGHVRYLSHLTQTAVLNKV